MVESEGLPGKGRIRSTTKKLSERVPKNVEFGGLTGKGRIRASTEKLSGRVPKSGRIRVSTEK